MSFFDDPAPPQQVNPALAVAAQSAANQEAIRESARISAIDQFSPFGSLTFQRDDEGIPTAQIQSLTPEGQTALDTQFDLTNTLGNAALSQAAFLPGDRFSLEGLPETAPNTLELDPLQTNEGLFGPNIDEIQNALYESQTSLLRPDFEQTEERLIQSLADRGIPLTSRAGQLELDRFQRQRDDTLSRIANAAVLAGGQEHSRLFGHQLQGRQQNVAEQTQNINLRDAARSRSINERLLERQTPFNELAAFLQGAPAISTPQFGNTPQFNVQPPDVIGAQFGAAQLANNAIANRNQTNAANLGGLFSAGSTLGAAALLRR